MMCEQCEEFPARFVAYFNKPGGKLWRPPDKAATTPLAENPQSAASFADPSLRSKPPAKPAFVCEETRSE
jgi:hypothetical protein